MPNREVDDMAETRTTDVAAVAKRDLRPGETLDGEGGYTVYGSLMPASESVSQAALPIGFAHGVRLREAVPKGKVVRWSDVEIEEETDHVELRREMERTFLPESER